MEQQTLMSREFIEGHLVETYTAENEAGFEVAFSEVESVEIDYDNVPVPAVADSESIRYTERRLLAYQHPVAPLPIQRIELLLTVQPSMMVTVPEM